MTIVENAVYVNGRRTDNPKDLDETYALMRERGGLANAYGLPLAVAALHRCFHLGGRDVVLAGEEG